MSDNITRAERARQALKHYAEEIMGEVYEGEADLINILTDLRHLCHQDQSGTLGPFDSADWLSEVNFEEEIAVTPEAEEAHQP